MNSPAWKAYRSRDRVTVLAGILQDKGLLNAADLAQLSLPSQKPAELADPSSQKVEPSAAHTVAASTPNVPSAPQQAVPEQPAEVNAAKKLPVTVYGTLLFNAGFNTTQATSAMRRASWPSQVPLLPRTIRTSEPRRARPVSG